MKVKQSQVDQILEESDLKIFSSFGKSVIISCKLPNGFVIEGVGSCVDEKEFDEQIGITVAKERLKDKIWQLLGYELQIKMFGGLTV